LWSYNVNLENAKKALMRTHIASLMRGERASGYMLSSGPGIGKTESQFQEVEELCIAIGEPVGLVQFMLATIQSPDVRGFGIPVKAAEGSSIPGFVFSQPPWYPVKGNTWVCEPDGKGGIVWHRPGTWDAAIPRVGVLFLDEWGQAEDDVKKPAAELLLNGNVGTCELPLGWRVVGATNRVSDRSGVVRELVFTVNRRCLLPVDPHMATFLNWAERQPEHLRPHFMTISFARKNPSVVFRDSVPDGYDPFCTPRSLVRLDKDLRALRTEQEEAADKMPTDDISREIAAGWIGEGSAGQYFTHLKYAEELPEIEDIERDPRLAKLPSGKDAQMVCAYMLAHHLTEENAQPIMRYVDRMNEEMQVVTMHVIGNDIKRQKAVVILPEYQQWLVKHKEVLKASQE
jgi:hypothetical protein